MSLPAIAIIVATASALFTASNMLVSLATYRRGGPRLKVRVSRRPYKLHEAYLAGDKANWRMSYHVHVVNYSSASVEVEKVQIIPHLRQITPIDFILHRILRSVIKKTLLNHPEMESWTSVELLEGEDRKKIEGFGGARWVLQEKLSTVAATFIDDGWADFLASVTVTLQLRVILANGREAYSRSISLRKLMREDRRARQILAEFHKEQAAIPGQLSFDDLDEESD
ncbi:hypothetical protein ACFY64_16940 [Streptomyces collinus]|uniref:hypothetical protein n=1 Tax=Streptomyces collinus TaxID=42684 RepID=UPI0036931A6A